MNTYDYYTDAFTILWEDTWIYYFVDIYTTLEEILDHLIGFLYEYDSTTTKICNDL